MRMTRLLALFLVVLVLAGSCTPGPGYTVKWVGPGPVAAPRYECMRETGGSEYRPNIVERAGLNMQGDRIGVLAFDQRVARHHFFMACMESKGFGLVRVPD